MHVAARDSVSVESLCVWVGLCAVTVGCCGAMLVCARGGAVGTEFKLDGGTNLLRF